MKTVKVKGIGVQVNGTSYFKNDVFDVTDEDFEPIKEYVDVLKEDKKSNQKNANERIVMIKVENKELDLKEVEEYLYNCLENFGKEENTDEEQDDGSDTNVGGNAGENSDEDEELEALKDRAKELGISVTHNMKKETIIKKIEEIEQDPGENPNPEGE